MEYGYYINRWDEWPIPVLSVPDKLNPFRNQNVDISVALAYHLPYENIKFLTVFGMLLGADKHGLLDNVHTLVEATSGNTGVVLATIAKSFGVKRVKLVVAPDLPDGKRYPFLLAGAEAVPPEEGLSPIGTARKLGGGGWSKDYWHANEGVLNLDQYANIYGTDFHARFTAPKILKQLLYPPTMFVAGVGTGGTLVGISRSLSERKDKVTVLGVLLKRGDEIPGVRDLNKMREITLPWRDSLDSYVEVESKPSYLAALWFNWVMGITPGPSSGFAYLGALKHLCGKQLSGQLDSLRDKRGRIHVVILFPDGNRPYGDRFMANLDYNCLRPSTAPMPWNLLGHELWLENKPRDLCK